MTDTSSHASVFMPVAAAPRAPDAPFHATRRRALLVAGFCFLVTLGARIWLVLTFGSSLPFWDQWGAEGTGIYKPLLDGTYNWQHLWSAHNEHHIALTRLWAIAVFYLNDMQWDARVQCLSNTVPVALATSLFAAYLVRRLPPLRAAVLCGLLLLAAVLPFSWENTIAGFQNAFYFLVLITLALLWTAARRAASPATFVLLALLSVLSTYTLATGLLAPTAACVVLVLRAALGRDSWRAMATLMFPLVLTAAIAATQIPHLAYHEPLKAQGLYELVRATVITTSWPCPPPALLLFALPFALFLWRLRQRRNASSVDLFFCGLFVWSALTAFATAHARGHGMLIVPSRYTDLLAFGCVAYAYFALRLLDGDPADPRWRRRLFQGIAAAVPLAIAAGLLLQSFLYLPALLDRHFLTRIETVNVRAFVDGDSGALDGKPPFYIPFPDAAALAGALSDGTVRRLLPISVAPRPDGVGRACSLNSTDSATPRTHVLDCTRPSAQQISVGPLSAVSHALWKRFALPLLPRFAEQPAPPVRDDVRCAVDALNASRPDAELTFTVPYAATLRFAGWSGRLQQPATARRLEIGLMSESGRYYAADTAMRLIRDDVVQALGDAGMKWSGFDLGMDASAVPQGHYRIFFGEPGFGVCDSGHALRIRRDSDELLSY